MLLATALALLIAGCAQQTFTVQNKPAAVAPKETITHHFFVSGIGQKKTVDAAKFVAAQKMLLKNRNPANIRKWIARFYYFRHLYSAEAALCACIYMRFTIDMGNITSLVRLFWIAGFVFIVSLSGVK